jgi:hypothetical protein
MPRPCDIVLAHRAKCQVNSRVTPQVHLNSTPSFTVSQTGNTVTLDASASPCHNGGCDFSWRLYRADGNRLGSTLGFGPVVTYTLPAAGVYQIVLTESEYCAPGGGASLRSCPGVAQQTVTAT